MFGILIMIILIANYFLFKRIALKIVGSAIILLFFGFSFSLSQRYMKTQEITYDSKNKLYSSLIKENHNFIIQSEKQYSLKNISKNDVPKRISILSEFVDSCNENDTIIELNLIGQIQKGQFWFIKKDSTEPKVFIRY